MMMEAAIASPSVSIQNLSLNYGAVSVLQTLNLDVAEGEFIVLLGPSGCGKSTLLNCIAGLLDASEGQIFIKGKNVTWEEPKDRGIGMVFQSYALYPQMTVEKNLSFGLKVAKMPRSLGSSQVTFLPLMKMRPFEMSSSPAMQLSKVDLPQPEGPRSTMNSPSAISRLSVCRTDTAP